ncbi:MAG: phosphoglycerate mutase family protein [Actinomycetota bacterium]|nr:phosphoglycerate mutase family protein [Actinomycetota bacterium]
MAGAATGTTIAYLVRHAEALSRGTWAGDDRDRPLSTLGRAQAEALADELAPAERGSPARALTSAAERCRETLVPTARRARIDLEELGVLAEGADPLGALEALVDAAALLAGGESVVACSHGDVIAGVLDTLAPAGVEVVGPRRAPKASVWVLEVRSGSLRRARYVGPPVARDA